VAEIVSERLSAERAGQPAIRIFSGDPKTPEMAAKRRRFFQEGRERARKHNEEVERLMAERSAGGREVAFTTFLERLWLGAQWMHTNQFVNGKPLGQQFGPELRVIYILLDGIQRWQARDKPPDEDFSYHIPKAMTDGISGSPHDNIG